MATSAMQGILLLPPNTGKLTAIKVQELLETYGEDLPLCSSFSQEVHRWTLYWNGKEKAGEEVPQNLADTLKVCNKARFANIHRILFILLVIPVTTATVERGNSALDFIKTALRSTMGQERLNALAMLYVHRDIQLDYKLVIDKFASRYPRRMLLVDPVSAED